jgi:hypothetical protein
MILNQSKFWRWTRPDTNTETIQDSSRTAANGSVANTIASMFGDDELSDIYIKCSDGGSIPVVKSIMAARSTVFRQLFYSQQTHHIKYDEGSTSEKVCHEFKEWDSRTLWMVVEYCYTDSCSVMSGEPTDDIARLIAHLRVASKKFQLHGLLEKVKQWSWRQLNRHPGLCCAMIDEGLKLNDIDETALQTLQIKTRAAMLPESSAVGSGVLSLSKPGLLFILRSIEDVTTHLVLLNVIETWVEFSSDENSDREKLTREAFGCKLANRFIKLSRISPMELAAATKRSNLLAMTEKSSIASYEDNQQRSAEKFAETSYFSTCKRTERNRRPHSAIGLVKPNTSTFGT